MKRILVIKPSSLGDIVHGLVAAQSIRDQWPQCLVTWVARERFAPLVQGCPTVDHTIVFERRGGPLSWLRLAKALRREEYDYALDFQGLARSALMLFLAKARVKIGRSDAREGASWACRQRAPLPLSGSQAHAVEILLQFLPVMGLAPRLGSPIRLGTEPLPADCEHLSKDHPIVLAPHSRDAKKDWKGYVELTRLLLKDRPGIPVVWDSPKAWKTPPDLADCPRFTNLTGRTNVRQMIGLIQSARVVVANDSGPMHIAAAVGTPVVACFGPTEPERFGPYPLDRATHRALRAPQGDLSKLAASTVFGAVAELLAMDPARP